MKYVINYAKLQKRNVLHHLNIRKNSTPAPMHVCPQTELHEMISRHSQLAKTQHTESTYQHINHFFPPRLPFFDRPTKLLMVFDWIRINPYPEMLKRIPNWRYTLQKKLVSEKTSLNSRRRTYRSTPKSFNDSLKPMASNPSLFFSF